MKTATIHDILGEQPPIPLESRHFVRFSDGSRWIDVELRDGEVTIRGSTGFLIEPHSANQAAVKLR
jgi:hypothetical protein